MSLADLFTTAAIVPTGARVVRLLKGRTVTPATVAKPRKQSASKNPNSRYWKMTESQREQEKRRKRDWYYIERNAKARIESA